MNRIILRTGYFHFSRRLCHFAKRDG